MTIESKAALLERANENALYKKRYEWLIDNIFSISFRVGETEFDDDGHAIANPTHMRLMRCPGCGKRLVSSKRDATITAFDKLMKEDQ